MKKIYNQPACIVVTFGSRDALLQSVSAQSTLGVTFRGTTSGNDVTDADVKGVTDKSLWDNEW